MGGGSNFLLLRKRGSFASRLELIFFAPATNANVYLSIISLVNFEAVLFKSIPSLHKVLITSVSLQVDELRNTPLTYLLRDQNDLIADQSRRDFAEQLMATWNMARSDDESGNSLLHYAAAFSDEHEVESLVEELGNVDITNIRGQTPLHLATFEGRTAGPRSEASMTEAGMHCITQRTAEVPNLISYHCS